MSLEAFAKDFEKFTAVLTRLFEDFNAGWLIFFFVIPCLNHCIDKNFVFVVFTNLMVAGDKTIISYSKLVLFVVCEINTILTDLITEQNLLSRWIFKSYFTRRIIVFIANITVRAYFTLVTSFNLK